MRNYVVQLVGRHNKGNFNIGQVCDIYDHFLKNCTRHYPRITNRMGYHSVKPRRHINTFYLTTKALPPFLNTYVNANAL